ncbi:ATP-binding protein [Phytomonospora endophytica]|uniref:DNA-binding CsgD family transcriptional regulator n=1 Tax=Phytomonospora endophytica TaxID=714109 RepID=A0A841FT04_9ACTN|nr:helix-turn-helix transcriptional regulator [Phytomonospora endophytica]MBB6037933.1 DNA-binding CsgD family transcriptional regulator [Phytomonospora endophytica]GIG68833.1 transcriptional regulator [Phytomonospora endophytica]
MLQGRLEEIKTVETLLSDARSGVSGVLVIKGDPGVGKSALLDHAARAAGDAGVLRGAGVETEVELPFAALHLLLSPALDRLDALPAPQAAALRGAFGLAPMETADRFLVGLATLSLLAELAEDGPLLAVVDDGQWLDQASAAALAFASRRLRSEGVALLVATRDDQGGFPTTGLPELRLGGLDRDDAERLLGEGLAAHLREQVLTEADGNPLALIELSKAASGGELDLAGPLPLTDRLMNAFAGQIRRLAEPGGRILAVAAAEDTGALGVVLAAAAELGIPGEALEQAEVAGLVTVTGGDVRFRHPLLRSAAYQAVTSAQRRAIHAALAGAVSGDRRAWHLALAATGPDEHIAESLEESAERSGARLGFAAMATAYERSAQLSAEQSRMARRLAAAAMAAKEAGQSGRAAELSERATRLTDDPATFARLAEVRAAVAYDEGSPRRAARLLIDGAARVAETDPRTTARMLMAASPNIWAAGDPAMDTEAELLLDRIDLPAEDPLVALSRGLRLIYADDLEAGYPLLSDFLRRTPPATVPGRLMTAYPAFVAGRLDQALELCTALASDCRTEGRIRLLPFALNHLAYTQVIAGHHRDSHANAAEGLQIALDTGQPHLVVGLQGQLAWLAAAEGDAGRCRELAEAGLAFAESHRSPAVALLPAWSLAMLDLTEGRDQAALDRLQARPGGTSHFGTRIVPDEVEAAVRLGTPELARESVELAERWTALSGETWAAALLARCHALLQDSEEHFTRALELHRSAPQPYEQARTLLAYGEWLRRRRRKAEARPHLRQAHEAFERLGTRPWAERAAAELRASGEATLARRSAAPGTVLTAQELQVVRLAATGATNRDIAAHLLLSPRTIGQHLYKAFPKLGISSRTELARLDLDRL